jgi:hypothetical protein
MFNAFGYFTTLHFQDVQHISATQESLRFLPIVSMGFATSILTDFLVDKLPASILVLAASLLSAVSPAVYAALSPKSSYWVAAFPAMCLSPVMSDLLFSVSNLVITANFRPTEQALASGIFNTISQLRNSIKLAMTAMIASSVTIKAEKGKGANSQTTPNNHNIAF